MGDWSVYCNFSHKPISERRKVVLLPFFESSYKPYCATLPIYGEYDGYGNIENIEKNNYTNALEKYFCTTIENFCKSIITVYDEKLEFLNQYENLKYLWVDREVWDFMSMNIFEDDSFEELKTMNDVDFLDELGYLITKIRNFEVYYEIFHNKEEYKFKTEFDKFHSNYFKDSYFKEQLWKINMVFFNARFISKGFSPYVPYIALLDEHEHKNYVLLIEKFLEISKKEFIEYEC